MEILHYPLKYQRLKTRVVTIRDLKIGGTHPICVQSMLTSSTQNTQQCLAEIKTLLAVNCRLIRLTIPSRSDLEAVYQLRKLMREEGLEVPLVADIHFSPTLAVDACELFEKVRINPGNYSDKPKHSKKINRDQHFEEGQEKLKAAILPLVDNLKKYQRALRIGVNQGSLSTRMIERYGDSPSGMVASALEMIEMFEEQGFDQLVVSLKSSNPIVVQKAYRLLVEKQKDKLAVPLHLGVTEAGDGIMGRIKSLAGIGPLLRDGIGDTIRVSLTEPSANEIIFAREFLSAILPNTQIKPEHQVSWIRPLAQQRIINGPLLSKDYVLGEGSPLKIGILAGSSLPRVEIPFDPDFTYQKVKAGLFIQNHNYPLLEITESNNLTVLPELGKYSALVISGLNPLNLARKFYYSQKKESKLPVGYLLPDTFDYPIQTELAGMLSEGLLDFILLGDNMVEGDLLSFLYLLQATRSRILVTDYITCPSCGRTLFDIQQTTALIKMRTSHLKGLKIGVMGCIVNGPGEMADADFGYVGSGPGKIDLYFGQERVCRGIDEEEAVEKLIDLIKEKGFWVE